MQAEPSTFEDDPMGFILKKYPGLNETMEYLMTKDFRDYVDAIFVVAPKPTTFKILLHNGQYFFLQFMGKTYQATVSGKNYYLMSLGEKERCMLAIARLLRYGNPLKTKGPEGAEQGTRPEGETGGEGGEAGAEVPEATPTGGEGGEETLKEGILEEQKNILKKLLELEDSEKKEDSSEPTDKPKIERTHDELIKKTLGVEEIPAPNTKVKLGQNFDLTDKQDKEIWRKLFAVSPVSKKGTGSKSSGYGEVAVAWLYAGQGYKVEDTTGSDNPDLKVNDVGLEIKAYGKDRVVLGKFAKDSQSVKTLNTIFGLYALVNSISSGEKKTEHNTNNFTVDALSKAAKKFYEIDNNSDLRELNIDLIKSIFNKIDEIKASLKIEEKYKPEDLVDMVLKNLLTNKLNNKPGIGGYILDCTAEGKGIFTEITKEKINSITSENLKDSVSVNSAQITVDFKKLFSGPKK
jgi:hypothetical protein